MHKNMISIMAPLFLWASYTYCAQAAVLKTPFEKAEEYIQGTNLLTIDAMSDAERAYCLALCAELTAYRETSLLPALQNAGTTGDAENYRKLSRQIKAATSYRIQLCTFGNYKKPEVMPLPEIAAESRKYGTDEGLYTIAPLSSSLS